MMTDRGSLNRVLLVGHLGADPELKYTPNGVAVTNFNLATNEAWRDKEGNQKDKTEWHRIVAWRKLAEVCGEYLKKGQLVFIEGKLRTRSYDDKDGIKKYITEVEADNMTMLGAKGSVAAVPSGAGKATNNNAGVGVAEDVGDSGEDDLPF